MSGTTLISDAQAAEWVAKGNSSASAVLDLAGEAGKRRRVIAARPTERPRFGNFMICWPDDHDGDPKVIRHLGDSGFFLDVLRIAYRPALRARPDLGVAFSDLSRTEVAFTNDVLQVQLQEVPSGYSMIRHHALMLFYGTSWLGEAARSAWFALYAGVADALVAAGPLPRRSELDAIERRAFDDFVDLAERSELAPQTLLADEAALEHILQYLRYAGAAIAAIESDYRSTSGQERLAWHRRHLQVAYQSNDYPMQELARLWDERRDAANTGGMRKR